MEEITVTEKKQFIVVKFDTEFFGIDIRYVDNIVRMQRITRVPKAQNYFKGVINLRGEIIPVMSMRLKFGLAEDRITHATRIIIIKPESLYPVGVIVDEVKQVITLGEDKIEKPNYESGDERAAYLSGIGKYGDTLISLLNIFGVIVGKEN